MSPTVLCCALALLASSPNANSPSPYAGQESREIKALSAQEISDYLSGRGMGFAEAAELNGYPGPAHVLELATQLGLSAEQGAETEALFQMMRSQAIALGKQLIDEERALDRLFASRSITPAALGASIERIAKLHGQLRQVHLAAHLRQTALLTPAQIAKYNQLRGYAESGGPSGQGHGRH